MDNTLSSWKLFFLSIFFYNDFSMKKRYFLIVLISFLCSCNAKQPSSFISSFEEGDVSSMPEEKTVHVYLDAAGGVLSESTLELKYSKPYSLPVPTSVSSMGNVQFEGWYHLDTKVDMSGDSFPFLDDVTLKAKWTNTDFTFRKIASGYEVASIKGDKREYIIPSMYDGEKVTCISSGAFKNRKNVTAVYLPDTLTEISHEAFYRCSNLKKLSLPKSIERIGYSAFDGCKKLKDVYYEGDVESWLKIEFEEDANPCMNSATLYFDNVALDEIRIQGIDRVPGESFHGVQNRMNVIMSDDVTSIGESAFLGSGLTSIVFSKNITQIKENCFQKCYSLLSATLPEKITSLPSSLFSSCFALKEVTLPNGVKEIPSSLFENCYALERCDIPEGVVKISANAFSGCRKLSEIILPASLEKISAGAFSNCSSLKEIHIPKNVKEISQGAFSTTPGVEKVMVDKENQTYREGRNAILDEEGNVLYGCKNTILEEGIRKILPQAFFGCSSLEELSFPTSLESIGDYAFSNSSLQALSIGDNLTYIGKNAFTGASKLKEILASNSNQMFSAKGNCLLDKDGKNLLLGCQTSIIPDTVENIAKEAFYYNSSIKEITIPSNVKTISDNAFSHCYSLKEVRFEEGLEEIGDEAFSFSFALREVKLPQTLAKIGEKTFSSCISLSEASLPDLKELPSLLFEDCTSLEKVNISKKTKSIDPTCFLFCPSLHDIEIEEGNPNYVYFDHCLMNPDKTELYHGCYLSKIGDGIKNIGAYSFYGQSLPSSLEIPEGVLSIQEEAFGQSFGLNSLTLPKSIKTIEENAFEGCDELSLVSYPGTQKEFQKVQLGFGCFYDTDIDSVKCSDGNYVLSDDSLE